MKDIKILGIEKVEGSKTIMKGLEDKRIVTIKYGKEKSPKYFQVIKTPFLREDVEFVHGKYLSLQREVCGPSYYQKSRKNPYDNTIEHILEEHIRKGLPNPFKTLFWNIFLGKYKFHMCGVRSKKLGYYYEDIYENLKDKKDSTDKALILLANAALFMTTQQYEGLKREMVGKSLSDVMKKAGDYDDLGLKTNNQFNRMIVIKEVLYFSDNDINLPRRADEEVRVAVRSSYSMQPDKWTIACSVDDEIKFYECNKLNRKKFMSKSDENGIIDNFVKDLEEIRVDHERIKNAPGSRWDQYGYFLAFINDICLEQNKREAKYIAMNSANKFAAQAYNEAFLSTGTVVDGRMFFEEPKLFRNSFFRRREAKPVILRLLGRG